MVVCGVCILLGKVYLPSGTTGSWVWENARAMKSVARIRKEVFLFVLGGVRGVFSLLCIIGAGPSSWFYV